MPVEWVMTINPIAQTAKNEIASLKKSAPTYEPSSFVPPSPTSTVFRSRREAAAAAISSATPIYTNVETAPIRAMRAGTNRAMTTPLAAKVATVMPTTTPRTLGSLRVATASARR